jgi:hypothetical protein
MTGTHAFSLEERIEHKTGIRQRMLGKGMGLLHATRIGGTGFAHFRDTNVVVRAVSCTPGIVVPDIRSGRMSKVIVHLRKRDKSSDFFFKEKDTYTFQ